MASGPGVRAECQRRTCVCVCCADCGRHNHRIAAPADRVPWLPGAIDVGRYFSFGKSNYTHIFPTEKPIDRDARERICLCNHKSADNASSRRVHFVKPCDENLPHSAHSISFKPDEFACIFHIPLPGGAESVAEECRTTICVCRRRRTAICDLTPHTTCMQAEPPVSCCCRTGPKTVRFGHT